MPRDGGGAQPGEGVALRRRPWRRRSAASAGSSEGHAAACSSRSARSSPRWRSTATATGRSSGCSAHVPSRWRRTRSSARPSTPSLRGSASGRRRIQLIDDGFPRLFVVGRGPRSSTLAVSTGALRRSGARSSRRAIAHELAHVRRRDVLVQTFVVLFAATLVETSRIGGWLSRALLYVFAPIAAAFVHLLLSPQAGARRRRARGQRDRRRTRSRRRAPSPRPRVRPRRLRRLAGDRAALSDRPVRGRRHRAHVQDAPASSTRVSRGSASSARARAGTAARRLPSSTSSPGRSENITESRIARRGCRRCARMTPSRGSRPSRRRAGRRCCRDR